MLMRFLRYLLALMLLLASIEYFATSTTLGLEVGILILNSFIPGHVNVTGIQGRLSDFTAENISYFYNKDVYQFKNVSLSWDPEKLWDKYIVINDIKINDATINVHTSSEKSTKFSAEFLQRLNIQKISTKTLGILVNGKSILHSNDTEINKVVNENQFDHLLNYSVQSKLYDGNLTGSFTLVYSPEFSIKSSTKWTNVSLGKIYPSITGKVNFGLQNNFVTNGIKYKLDLNVFKLNGNFKQYLISGNTSLHLNNDTLTIEPSELKIANAYAKISGNIKQTSDLEWNITIPNLAIFFPDTHGSLSSTGHFSGNQSQPNIKGKLNIPFIQFNKGNTYISELKQLKADIIGKLSLSKNVADIDLANAEAIIPKLGVFINKINLSSHYNNNILTVNGSLASGKGIGKLDGNIQLDPLQLKLQLNGKNLQVVNLAEYKIAASPEIKLSYDPTQTIISGSIFIPTAVIKPIDLSGTTSLTDDVVFVNTNVKKPSIPSSFTLQTKIVLGDAIEVDYENLQAKVKGELMISQTPGREPVASGQLNLINGTYKAYGKLLTIKNGRIIYTGNLLSNPGLDITATREVKTITMSNASQFDNNSALIPTYSGTNNVTVGIQIKGLVKKPILTLFSSPAGMNQNDILSYLLFGYPKSELSSDNKFAILSAASSLKLGNVNLSTFTSKIQNLTGLSELNIESTPIYNTKTNTTQNETMLSLGKKISDKLSVHYSVGLYSSSALLNIRYQISKRILLQTETSYLENGVDLLYGFERD